MPDSEHLHEDAVSRYYSAVSDSIKKAMKKQGITQELLVRECERLGIPIVQGTVSKIVNYRGKGHLSLIYIAAICQNLKLNMNEVLSLKGEDYSVAISNEYKYEDIVQSETLIENPRHSAFQGYIEKEFDLFFFPTISSESGILKGTLSLAKVNDEYCGASVILDVPKKGTQKTYTGRMLISLQQQACYINLVSKRLGEMCSLYFYHRFFSESSLKVRLAVAVTVCAGDDRRPTMHRVVICEKGVIHTDEQMSFIESQLLLNDSKIRISENELGAIGKEGQFTKIVEDIKRLARPNEGTTYYQFEESDILKIPDHSFQEIAEIISRMRKTENSKRYNKIGDKADAMLYKYLFKIEKLE